MHVSIAEWQGRAPSDGLDRELATALQTTGYFVLEQVIAAEQLSELLAEFTKLLEAHIANSPANRGARRYNLQIPMERPFADPEIIANPLVLPLLSKLLGDDLACSFFASDTPLPGSDYQAAHADVEPLFPEVPLALPAFAIVVNIPLVDFRADNGPIEVWPQGTHLISEVAPADGIHLLEPQQVLMPAGSLLVRDPRMWHRGTPNRTTELRPNLALVYHRDWYRFEKSPSYRPIPIRQTVYDSLPVNAQQLFRFARIGTGTTD